MLWEQTRRGKKLTNLLTERKMLTSMQTYQDCKSVQEKSVRGSTPGYYPI
jgi:hypothetical protein